MNDLVVKSVDLFGDSVMAAKDKDGSIWAGVGYFCKALGMSNKQRDAQVEKVQTDRTLRRGTRKFPGGVFDPNNEVVSIKIVSVKGKGYLGGGFYATVHATTRQHSIHKGGYPGWRGSQLPEGDRSGSSPAEYTALQNHGSVKNGLRAIRDYASSGFCESPRI